MRYIQDVLPGMKFLGDSDRCPWCPKISKVCPNPFPSCRCEEEYDESQAGG